MGLQPSARRRHLRSKLSHSVNRRLVPCLYILLILVFLLLFVLFLALTSPALLQRANWLGRRCFPRDPLPARSQFNLSIAIVSLSDEADGSGSGPARRSFKGLMAAVGRNKRSYAARSGYDYVERGAEGVAADRPPSWSKILAIWVMLPAYHWVFWNDADTLVTNPDITLESVLFSVIGHDDFLKSPDLILTQDFNGVNAGVFFVRRSSWSEKFLSTWWNMTSFVQFGSTTSGDNAALKYLINNLSPEELQEHVLISKMQCLFNSYPWTPTSKSIFRLLFFPWTTWKGVYSDGDFLIHFAGLDDKYGWTTKISREMKARGWT